LVSKRELCQALIPLCVTHRAALHDRAFKGQVGFWGLSARGSRRGSHHHCGQDTEGERDRRDPSDKKRVFEHELIVLSECDFFYSSQRNASPVGAG
jgi:hypothetical protein